MMSSNLQKNFHFLSIRNGHLFVPTIHHGTPSMGLKHCTDDGMTKFALLPRKMVINSTVLKSEDRLYHNKICDALDNLEHAQQKSFQRGYSHHVFTEKITSTALLEYNQTMLKLVFLHKHIIFQVCLCITTTL